MPAPSRRTPAARGSARTPAASARKPVVDAAESGTEEIDPAAAPAPASTSSRRGAAKSGRGAARSDRAATAKSRPVKALSPEEIAARRARIKLILIVLGASLAGMLVLVGLLFLLREDPRARTARDALASAESLRGAADRALDGRDPIAAAKAIEAALAALNIPEVDFASDPPNTKSEHLADPAHAINAARLKRSIEDEAVPRLKKMEREIRAELNHKALEQDYARLSESALDLADLESRVTAFIANPVEPEAGPNETYASDHARLVERMKLRLPELEREKRRREAQVTSDPIRLAEIEVQNLVRSERFADAKARVERLRSEFPKTADQAAALDRRVDESARKTWAGIEQYVQTRIDDIQAAGTPPSRRATAAQEARDRLDQVLNTFGLEDYLGQARALRDRLPPP